MAEKEYIEREALRNELLKISIFTDDLYGMGILEGLDRATRRVNNAPAADVVEVVHARWIDHKNGNATCSHCRIRQTAVYDDENEQNFCGHCGAKMDGGKHETD